MLAEIAREFGFTIGTYQHGLEAYKVAEVVRERARGASIFSDWWAYKVEVQDAIAQAGPVMWEAGVNVSYNSDSDNMVRRLNTEAAKAVKYGNVPRGRGVQVRHHQPRLPARHREPRRVDRGRQRRGPRHLVGPAHVNASASASRPGSTAKQYFSIEKDNEHPRSHRRRARTPDRQDQRQARTRRKTSKKTNREADDAEDEPATPERRMSLAQRIQLDQLRAHNMNLWLEGKSPATARCSPATAAAACPTWESSDEQRRHHAPTRTRHMSRTFKVISSTIALGAASTASAQDLGHKAPPQSMPDRDHQRDHPPDVQPHHRARLHPLQRGCHRRGRRGRPGLCRKHARHRRRGQARLPGPHRTRHTAWPHRNQRRSVRPDDRNEVGNVTPEVRACVAVNPDSTLIPVTRANGIMTFGAFPIRRRDPGPGSRSCRPTDGPGRTWRSKKTRASPSTGPRCARPTTGGPTSRTPRQFERIQERIDEHRRDLPAGHQLPRLGTGRPATFGSNPCSVSCPDADGEAPANPVFISANDVDQINAAVTWATAPRAPHGDRRRQRRATGRRASPHARHPRHHHRHAAIPEAQATRRTTTRTRYPIELSELGIRWCMASSDDTAHERNLPYNVAKVSRLRP